MQQNAVARQVLEEADPQARPVRRPFNQPGDVRHHEAAMGLHFHHPEIRYQRGKGIIGDLGRGGGDRPDKRGFARIGQAQQAHIRQHFQFQLEVAVLALAAPGGLARRPVGAGLEAGVAQPVKAALGHDQALARHRQVSQHFTGVLVEDSRAHRHQ